MSSLLEERIRVMSQILADAQVAYESVAKSKNGAAIAAMSKRVQDAAREVYDLRAQLEAMAPAAARMTEDQVIASAIEDLAALPDPLLDEVLRGLVHAGRGAALRRCAPPRLAAIQ